VPGSSAPPYPQPWASVTIRGAGARPVTARSGPGDVWVSRPHPEASPAIARSAASVTRRQATVPGVSTDTTILHITTEQRWADAQAAGSLVAPSLGEEGFIHCSTHAQVEATANRIFRGSGDLLLLELDPGKLTAPLKWERATDVGEEFPHIYGPLNVDAVVGTRPLPEGADGYVLG
jgi:uncharacterized protein (DUF952 family)